MRADSKLLAREQKLKWCCDVRGELGQSSELEIHRIRKYSKQLLVTATVTLATAFILISLFSVDLIKSVGCMHADDTNQRKFFSSSLN